MKLYLAFLIKMFGKTNVFCRFKKSILLSKAYLIKKILFNFEILQIKITVFKTACKNIEIIKNNTKYNKNMKARCCFVQYFFYFGGFI